MSQWNHQKNCVVVPFMPSVEAIEAIKTARKFVASDENILVVHVIPPAHVMTPGVVYGVYNVEDLEKRARLSIQEELTKNGLGKVSVRIMTGDPAPAIRQAAGEAKAELIVIPSHGRSGFERWFIGSVAEHVLRHSPCPVLVLQIQEPHTH